MDDLRVMADSMSHQHDSYSRLPSHTLVVWYLFIARSFRKEIRAFKGEMKRTIDIVSVLAGAAVSGGGFIPLTT